MTKKLFLTGLLIIVAGVIITWYYIFQYPKTHHRNVESENAIKVSAEKIVRDYETNEGAANAKYLNKAVQVRGTIIEKKMDQAGDLTLTLRGGDSFSNVFCTLKPGAEPASDLVVEVKGVCTGFLSDVVLNEAIVIRQRIAAK